MSVADQEDSRPRRLFPYIGTSSAVTALIIVLLALLSVLTGYMVWREHDNALARAEAQAERTAGAAAEHVRWVMEANLQALRRVDMSLGTAGRALSALDVADIFELQEILPAGTTIRTFDAEGRPLLTTEESPPTIDISDRGYFRALAGGERIHVSPLLIGRASGRRIFVVGRRIERDGEFLGIAVAILPAQLMSSFWAALDLGSNASVGLVREDGMVVSRHPAPEGPVDLSGHELFTEHLPSAPSGYFRSSASPVDAVPRIVGYHKIPGLPLIAVAGVARGAALEDFHDRLGILMVFGLPLVLVLLVGSIWGAKVLRRDERTRDKLADALGQNQMLMREIHHRVKNNLQVVSALVQMQPGPPEAKRELSRRIAVMALTHEHIYATDQFEHVDLAEYLRKLVEALKDAHGSSVEVDYQLEPLTASNDVALPLALIIGEVVSNAFKHAFPDERQGRLSVSLQREDPATVCVTVKDNGIGHDGTEESSGLGMRLIDSFARQIHGQYTFERGSGTTFLLRFSLPRDKCEHHQDKAGASRVAAVS